MSRHHVCAGRTNTSASKLQVLQIIQTRARKHDSTLEVANCKSVRAAALTHSARRHHTYLCSMWITCHLDHRGESAFEDLAVVCAGKIRLRSLACGAGSLRLETRLGSVNTTDTDIQPDSANPATLTPVKINGWSVLSLIVFFRDELHRL